MDSTIVIPYLVVLVNKMTKGYEFQLENHFNYLFGVPYSVER